MGEHSGQKDLQLKVSTNEINVIGLGYVISQDKKSGSSGKLKRACYCSCDCYCSACSCQSCVVFGSAEEAETMKI